MSEQDHHRPLPECVVEFRFIREKLDEIHRAVSGTNGEPGLKLRVDRLEQVESRRGRYSYATFVALAGLVGERLWQIFTKG